MYVRMGNLFGSAFSNRCEAYTHSQCSSCCSAVCLRATQGVGLCHGISGNAYCFLALYRATGEVRQLHRARHFALFAAQNWRALYDTPDNPASLYEGLAGAVCLWAHVLHPASARFPGFEL